MRAIIGLALAAGALGVSAPASAATAACDRTCLKNIAEQYLAAFVAHDPSKAPLAADARYTEMSVPTKIGEGLWKTVISRVPGGSFLIDRIRARSKPPPRPSAESASPSSWNAPVR